MGVKMTVISLSILSSVLNSGARAPFAYLLHFLDMLLVSSLEININSGKLPLAPNHVHYICGCNSFLLMFLIITNNFYPFDRLLPF